MERREDLPPGAFRGNPRNLGDDEILGPAALPGNDRLLEAVRFRIRPEGGVDVARVAQGGADLIRFGTLALDGIRDVRVDGLLKLAPHDVPVDDMRDGPHGTEALQAEEIREATERTDLAGGLFGNRNRPILREGEIPDDNLEAVAGEVSDLEGKVRARQVKDLDVLHPQGLDRLGRDVLEGEQLRRERPFVFRPGESDPPAADVQASGA